MSATKTLALSTHSADNTEQLDRIYDVLTAGEALNPVPRYYLVGGSADEPIELPEDIYRVLLDVVEAMKRGLSVTLSPTSQTLTTQQAADLLGISRPTLIKALDNGKLPFTRSGSHRRIMLTDVLNYREERRQEQYAAIEALSTNVDETSNIEETLADLRAARKVVSAKQKRKS